MMLAVRQAGVTVTTGTLQQAGFIRNRRGLGFSIRRDSNRSPANATVASGSRKRPCWLICRRKLLVEGISGQHGTFLYCRPETVPQARPVEGCECPRLIDGGHNAEIHFRAGSAPHGSAPHTGPFAA